MSKRKELFHEVVTSVNGLQLGQCYRWISARRPRKFETFQVDLLNFAGALVTLAAPMDNLFCPGILPLLGRMPEIQNPTIFI